MSNLNQFIEEELLKRKGDYLSSPAYILEHYNIERQNIQTYNGRQLLEMLQNADDASENAIEKKVLIKLNGNELVIANNGEPFNEDGFRSIIYSNLSSKTMQQNKIGQKGLGFRSILSWSDEVIINSGGIKLGFSEAIAKNFLENLITESSTVSTFIKQKSKSKFPIATLRVPELLNGEEDSIKNYDTTISIRLKENIFDDVQSQIFSVINKETLIFLNHIEIIEIDSPERKIIYKKDYNKKNKNRVTVESVNLTDNSIENKSWNIKRKKGTHKEKNYELAIAWNDELNDTENVLFSYFKTQVRFPFPALLHGTFELSQNRNQLDNDTEGHNKFLTGELADLLIESSLEITSYYPESNYSAVKLLNIDFEKIDTALIEFKFKDILQAKIKTSSIFPTANKKYISYSPAPAFYKYPVANILSGKEVENLLKFSDEDAVIKIIESFGMCHYQLGYYLKIISKHKNDFANLSKLIYHLLTFSIYVVKYSSSDFNLLECSPFLVDNENELIPWEANIFIQPKDEKEFKLPKSLNIRFINSDLINLLLREFQKNDSDFLIDKLEVFQVKKYSFLEIAETLINHYNEKETKALNDIRELHSYLFSLFKREAKNIEHYSLSLQLQIPVICEKKKIRNSGETYFGKSYRNELTEQLYNFDKSRLLASPQEFDLDKEEIELLRKYFQWLGVADFPRYQTKVITMDKNHLYIESIFRNYKYPLTKWGWNFKDFNAINNWIPGPVKINVGEFDEIDKILLHCKIEIIFNWIKFDKRLKETLENDREINNNAFLYFYFHTDRRIEKQEILSYTRWKFSTIIWFPVKSESKKNSPDKCCLSKTITDDFSPFVEKPKIDIASLSDKLELSEDVIENYLVFVGVHREISSFSISALYEVLSSLTTSDKEGKVARKIYREIISNFNENKIDITHPSYKSFTTKGKMLCQKGNEVGYFPVSETYYIPTKTYGNNVLKLFPLAMIDSKQGPQKIEKLFGVKRLKDISFNITGEPTINVFNDEFQNEIERFKGLVYVLRMNKDTNHDIANKLKKLKIFLSQELQTNFTHNEQSTNFELEPYEYINHKKRNQFYISVPSNLTDANQLRESNKFCQSIAEIFSTIIETEEYSDFIHDLYSRQEFSREPRLLNYIQREDNIDVIEAKKQLNIIDDVRLSFWRAFSIASEKNIKTEIRNEKGLNYFLEKKLKFKSERIEIFSSTEIFTQLNELSNQELIYEIFIEFDVDFKSFVRHFSGLDFLGLFKNKFEDLKISYRSEFGFQLYNNLTERNAIEKAKYFDFIDDYNILRYNQENGFLKNIENHFIKIVEKSFAIKLKNRNTDFSIEEKINQTLTILSIKEIIIPSLLKEKKSIQAYLLFNEEEEIKKQIETFNLSNQNSQFNSNTNQIKVRGATIDYDDYQALAEKVLEGLNIAKLKLKIIKTLPIEEEQRNGKGRSGKSKTRNVRFSNKNEEQIGFIAELICYHKLNEKYGEENIKWVSENAYRAYPEKFMTSEAGKGYDLELTDNGKVRFIEIKGTSNIDEGIHMSKEEIKTALEFPDKYDLLIVENPLSNEPNFKHVKSPFKFKKEESLFSNDKLKVFNDNYVIKFKWDE